jgi:hypothetical protein
MATIFVITCLDINYEEKERLFDALDQSAGPAFENHHSLLLEHLAPENYVGSAAGHTTVLVMNPPYETGPDVRRMFVSAAREAFVKVLGPGRAGTVDVIFRFHEDDEVGVDGVIRSDAAAAGQYP